MSELIVVADPNRHRANPVLLELRRKSAQAGPEQTLEQPDGIEP